MADWDPIGVSDTPEAADEYDMYIGGIFGLLQRGESLAAICAYLREVEVDRMGMVDASGRPFMPETKRRSAASSLYELRTHFSAR